MYVAAGSAKLERAVGAARSQGQRDAEERLQGSLEAERRRMQERYFKVSKDHESQLTPGSLYVLIEREDNDAANTAPQRILPNSGRTGGRVCFGIYATSIGCASI